MPSYSCETKLPSCKITRTALEKLEDYILKASADLCTNAKYPADYKIIIKDSEGRETLSSIRDFDRENFLNDTRAIQLRIHGMNPQLTIDINFNRSRFSSDLEISYSGLNPREVVAGLRDGILIRLQPYKTNNAFIHSKTSLILSGVFGVLTILFLIGPIDPITPIPFPSWVKYVGIFLLFLEITFGMLVFTKHYSVFDTLRNERIGKQVNWILVGLLGFLLFTVIGVYFRGKLLGF